MTHKSSNILYCTHVVLSSSSKYPGLKKPYKSKGNNLTEFVRDHFYTVEDYDPWILIVDELEENDTKLRDHDMW